MLIILGLTAATFLLSIPLLRFARSERRLTWASAVGMATYLVTIALLLIAEIPSRLLYWFDANHVTLADKFAFISPVLRGDQYIIARDIVVNSVQGLFFVILCVGAYLWGEKQRKAGKFKA